MKKSESLLSVFFKDWQDQFAHGPSFVKSNKSGSILLIFKKEPLIEEGLERFALFA